MCVCVFYVGGEIAIWSCESDQKKHFLIQIVSIGAGKICSLLLIFFSV